MIEQAGDRLRVSGPMTLVTARQLLEDGVEKLRSGIALFDLSTVEDVDSSGLSVIFGWQRAAGRENRKIRIVNLPQNLLSLATLYGVDDLLPA
jgi:phospholipid transport system transporter-binding protein